MMDQYLNESIEFHTKFSKIVILKKKKTEKKISPSKLIPFQIITTKQTQQKRIQHTHKTINATKKLRTC